VFEKLPQLFLLVGLQVTNQLGDGAGVLAQRERP
jgi:hypothetical protein